MKDHPLIKWLQEHITPWVVVGAISVGGTLLASSFLYLWLSKPASPLITAPTAVMTVIPPPTATIPVVTITPDIWSTPTPTITSTSSPLEIHVGGYVQIVNTGGSGLNLRAAPGLSENINYLGLEAEVFIVRDGPRNADNFTWWYLVAPIDESRNGWGVADYLAVIINP
jgi:hypothetical protein